MITWTDGGGLSTFSEKVTANSFIERLNLGAEGQSLAHLLTVPMTPCQTPHLLSSRFPSLPVSSPTPVPPETPVHCLYVLKCAPASCNIACICFSQIGILNLVLFSTFLNVTLLTATHMWGWCFLPSHNIPLLAYTTCYSSAVLGSLGHFRCQQTSLTGEESTVYTGRNKTHPLYHPLPHKPSEGKGWGLTFDSIKFKL